MAPAKPRGARDGNERTREPLANSISSRLAGLLKPADLIAHYRPQLDAAGWRTRAPVTTGEDAALAYVEATDSTGAIWRGVMLAVQSAPSEATVEIKMFKASGR